MRTIARRINMFRLPEGWSEPQVLRDVVVADGVRIHRSGLAAVAPTGEEVCGAAADAGEATGARAWFELAERVCVVEAEAVPRRVYRLLSSDETPAGTLAGTDAFRRVGPRARWVPARSNGVAFHRDWARASARAHWELVERDRVLRAWLGSLVPVPVQITRPPPTRRYEWLAYAFPACNESLSPEIEVVGVFAFPRSDRLPLAMGFAARTSRRDSLAAASAEALQQLAFLWGLPVSRRGTRTEKPTPRLHLDTYQRPTRRPVLRAWLAGEHAAYAPRQRTTSPGADQVRFIDLTPPWLAGKARVAKAVSARAVPFGFGELPSTRRLPLALRIHPIP